MGPEFSASIIQVSRPWPGLRPATAPPGRRRAARSPQQPFDPEALPRADVWGDAVWARRPPRPSSTTVSCGAWRRLLLSSSSPGWTQSPWSSGVDRVNVHSPHRAMAALGLMLTCMYTGEPGKRVPLGARRRGSAGAFRLRGVRAPSGSRESEPHLGAALRPTPVPCVSAGPCGPRPRVRPSVGVPAAPVAPGPLNRTVQFYKPATQNGSVPGKEKVQSRPSV